LAASRPSVSPVGESSSATLPWTTITAGRANHPATVSIPVNDHQTLTDSQYDWPTKTYENPEGSPLLAGAACIRGYYDTNSYLNEQLLLWVARLLETRTKLCGNGLDRIGGSERSWRNLGRSPNPNVRHGWRKRIRFHYPLRFEFSQRSDVIREISQKQDMASSEGDVRV